MILFYFSTPFTLFYCFIRFQFHYDLILLFTVTLTSFPCVAFQFHYDLILFINVLEQKELKEKFQFHYDLILFIHRNRNFPCLKGFQFHYDLILFVCCTNICAVVVVISISLWSYSIEYWTDSTYKFYIISISLWSYSIVILTIANA